MSRCDTPLQTSVVVLDDWSAVLTTTLLQTTSLFDVTKGTDISTKDNDKQLRENKDLKIVTMK